MQSPSISEIEPGLFIGNATSSHHTLTLRNNHITAIVSLVNARLIPWTLAQNRELVPKDRHLWIECVDSSTQDILVHMGNICDFIDRMFLPRVQPPSSTLPSQPNPDTHVEASPSAQPPGGVLVHCDQGISRSTTIVVAYLMRKHGAKREDVLAAVRAKRKVRPSPNFMAQLEVWEQVGYQIWEDGEGKIPKEPYRAYTERRAADLKAKGLTGNEPMRPLNL
ncbi:hypothetical protein MMC16_006851 [Acarospora aff. strigata]|nr:hypothetical protein [Acarospora aff. strigata]